MTAAPHGSLRSSCLFPGSPWRLLARYAFTLAALRVRCLRCNARTVATTFGWAARSFCASRTRLVIQQTHPATSPISRLGGTLERIGDRVPRRHRRGPHARSVVPVAVWEDAVVTPHLCATCHQPLGHHDPARCSPPAIDIDAQRSDLVRRAQEWDGVCDDALRTLDRARGHRERAYKAIAEHDRERTP